ncbi:MAG: hybrid sensor histidine kinase/response regulator [Candidatus Omnitrophota bacterium]
MTDEIRVLLLEDVPADAELIQQELKRTPGTFLFRRVQTKDDFLKALDEFSPNLVLSDYVLEAFEGLSALALAREKAPDLPFIFVSWQIHEDSVIEAIKKGATDYVFKEQITRLTLSVFRALREAAERAELKSTQERIVEQERLGALGKMASGIAHDFSNALTPVLGYTELLIGHPEKLKDTRKLAHYVNMMHLAAKDGVNLVNQLREFYRRRERVEKIALVNLSQIAEQVVLLTEPKWKAQALANGATIRVKKDLADTPLVAANDSALRDALTNLIFNAVDALPAGGVITVRTRAEGGRVALEVSDTGEGMTEEVRRHCFEPFFSTKGKSGTGMGLAMVYGVVRRHEGTIEVESERGKGTTFVIRLPLRDPASFQREGAALPAAPGFTKRRGLKILIVDDDAGVLELLKEYLTADEHAVETAANAAEALQKFGGGKFDLVFTDWAMPGMNGNELSLKLKQQSPATPIIMLTGFHETIRSAGGEKPEGVDLLLTKPPTLEAVRAGIAQVTRLKFV